MTFFINSIVLDSYIYFIDYLCFNPWLLNFTQKDLENIDGDLCIPSGEDWFGINDRFSLGSSETMDVYCDIYNSFSLIRHIPYHPETMLNEFLKIRRIEPKRFDFNVSISSVRNY